METHHFAAQESDILCAICGHFQTNIVHNWMPRQRPQDERLHWALYAAYVGGQFIGFSQNLDWVLTPEEFFETQRVLGSEYKIGSYEDYRERRKEVRFFNQG